MKIAIISTHYGNDIGGAEVSTRLLVDGLKKAKHNIKILSLNNRFTWMPLSVKAFLLNTKLLDKQIEDYLYRKLKKTMPDIVHIQDLMISPAAIRAAKRLNLKTMITVRDLRFVCNLPTCQNRGELCYNCNKQQYLNCLKKEAKMQFNCPQLAYLLYPFIKNRSRQLRKALSEADKLIAISNFVKQELQKANIKTEIEVVHNPMPNWKPQKQKKHNGLILFAPGRLEKYKGFHLLIKAMPEILKKRKDAVLWIAGDGNYREQLKRLIKKLNLEQHVLMLGRLPQEELKQRYYDCDVVVFPSIWLEPLGRIPLEAMAVKKPIVASDKGGIKEIAGKGNVCDISNTEEFVKQILNKHKPLTFRPDLTLGHYIKTMNNLYTNLTK
jgi:glycosyltransferase involved in cell wall biosynthesis